MDTKELQKLIKILRKSGITEYKSGQIELKLGPLPEPKRRYKEEENPKIEGQYTDEDVLFWSSAGLPGAN